MVRKGEDHIALAEAVCVGLRETILPSEKMFILGPQFIFFNSAHITKSSSEKGRKRERVKEREREKERERLKVSGEESLQFLAKFIHI